MLQVIAWGIGVLLIGLGFMLRYMTKAFPAREIKTNYRCESCGKVYKENQDGCECGGYFVPARETVIMDPQPSIYGFVSVILIVAGPVFIYIANVQAATVSGILGY